MGGATMAAPEKVLRSFLSLTFLLLALFYLSTRLGSSYPTPPQPSEQIIRTSPSTPDVDSSSGCSGIYGFESYSGKCNYLNSEEARCRPEGYINYLRIFYCVCGEYPILGYTILILWLLLLFYLLGNTAATYFCSNLEGLSRLLKLSPTIAGVTLLSLGNGAPDAFSSIVSFVGNGTTDVGLNSVLGGAFFVSSVVVGIISICLGPRRIAIDKTSFVRDVSFFLFVLSVLLVIFVVGKINLWCAVAFTSLYAVYVFLVSITHLCRRKDVEQMGIGDGFPALPADAAEFGGLESAAPLLATRGGEWGDEPKKPACGSKACFKACFASAGSKHAMGRALRILELPLYLPRRLTIPDACEERWSKPFAVISVTLAPTLLAALWNSKSPRAKESSLVVHVIGGLLGTVLGGAALARTRKERPPAGVFLFPWLAGGFLMSVVWAYIIAEELVSLLVSLGVVLQVSSSVLGLTVLAWGNSLGDLIANAAVALKGGPGGAQTAMSGCYGGPIFNTLVGLGLSLVLSSWAAHPSPLLVPVPDDPTLYQTVGFLMAGLLWALVMLPRRGMTIHRGLGYGLLSIYACFLSLRILQSVGLLQIQQ
ncbi:cation/calcium exchanger 1-like [Ananas comosus]|uniref:Cation/calcium exchanger 1-like n=1 Tax=Ananas comosus TaxID=4615 RepID=A0A6P5G8M4_ANACO|nr:cation/calcium exchanger 1-like [Ananas comosus]XP_020104959.1 cation/calcium exchanger 1-like [Ananas comosus]XP_020104960.1 cation/calcium exchanger 1-like [Ananas comosus]XP_020104961.1 cation/calcium exchanger 1-like [Ananas comosus]XP_020104962.1 cation/calcium exchanger 1-like [Ananas comosus]XP_020104963.1 cation/calcium exchanger 1-like [Ananas comosus]